MLTQVPEKLAKIALENGESYSLYLCNLNSPEEYEHKTEEKFYPASLIKLFSAYIAKKTKNSDIDKAIEASLKDSDNDALSLVYDCISDTNSGLALEENSLDDFTKKRNSISKYFHELGFSQDLKLHNKCYSFAPYGRDEQLFLKQGSNQVLLSDIKKIMNLYINDCNDLLEYMSRNGDCEQSQFIYAGLDSNKIDFFYSKAAWTSTVRHDAAYFSYEGTKYLLIILTKGLSENKDFIPKLSSSLFS